MIHTPLRPVELSHEDAGQRRDRVVAVVSHLAHLLPAQGPIGVFIHQNTLHAFQHMPFEEAVCAAATTYGTEPFMTVP